MKKHISQNNLTTLLTFLIFLIFLFTFSTYTRNAIWQNEITLWQDVVNKSPLKAQTHSSFAAALSNINLLDDALGQINRAIDLSPSFEIAYYNRGNIHWKMGLVDLAIFDFTTAIVLRPNYAEAYNNRGTIYNKTGKPGKAVADFKEVIAIYPDNAIGFFNLGNAQFDQAEYFIAIDCYTKAISLQSEFLDKIYFNRGLAYREMGLFEDAEKDFQMASKITALKPPINRTGISSSSLSPYIM